MAIGEAKKSSNEDNHPESYGQDMFLTHVDHFNSDGGMEIAPFTRFFHFHFMLKIVHFSKVMFNYLEMSNWLEEAFKGRKNPEWKLVDLDGSPLYKDSERPHVKLDLYPQDDWQQILMDYRHKDSEDRATQQQIHGANKPPEARVSPGVFVPIGHMPWATGTYGNFG